MVFHRRRSRQRYTHTRFPRSMRSGSRYTIDISTKDRNYKGIRDRTAMDTPRTPRRRPPERDTWAGVRRIRNRGSVTSQGEVCHFQSALVFTSAPSGSSSRTPRFSTFTHSSASPPSAAEASPPPSSPHLPTSASFESPLRPGGQTKIQKSTSEPNPKSVEPGTLLLFLNETATARSSKRNMSIVNVTNVVVLDNPTAFRNPLTFEVTFECLEALDAGERASCEQQLF